MKVQKSLPIVDRRQFLASSAVGALLGAAWGTSFLAAELGSEYPTITIHRTQTLIAMLVEHNSVRVLLLDGDGESSPSDTTEGVTGFLRQRIDVVLAPDAVLRSIPPDFIDRWEVSAIYPLPDQRHPYSTTLDGRTITFGGLSIQASSVSLGAWRATSEIISQPWCVSVRFGSACCFYGSTWDALRSGGNPEISEVVLAVTNDQDARIGPLIDADIVAVPANAVRSIDAAKVTTMPYKLVRLYRDFPLSIQLRTSSIVVPQLY